MTNVVPFPSRSPSRGVSPQAYEIRCIAEDCEASYLDLTPALQGRWCCKEHDGSRERGEHR